MKTFSRETRVGVVGAGAMGSGIAQVAAAYGHPVLMVDMQPGAVERAFTGIEKNLARSVEKARITSEDAKATRQRITAVAGDSLESFADCGLVIEAVVEDLGTKRELFASLEKIVAADTVLGTNTSSLSITSIASACTKPERVIGVHFFNPPTVLPLVEIIPGLATDASVAAEVERLVETWGKTTVVASDTPGFIVNRIARPFYGEALRI